MTEQVQWFKYYKKIDDISYVETYISFEKEEYSDESVKKDCYKWALLGTDNSNPNFVYGYVPVVHPPKKWLENTIAEFRKEISVLTAAKKEWETVLKEVNSYLKKEKERTELPKNLESAVDYVIPLFEDILPNIKKLSEEDFLGLCHSISFGIGMEIRNELNLWDEKSPLRQYLSEYEDVDHPDDQSDLILRGVYKKII